MISIIIHYYNFPPATASKHLDRAWLGRAVIFNQNYATYTVDLHFLLS